MEGTWLWWRGHGPLLSSWPLNRLWLHAAILHVRLSDGARCLLHGGLRSAILHWTCMQASRGECSEQCGQGAIQMIDAENSEGRKVFLVADYWLCNILPHACKNDMLLVNIEFSQLT